MKGLFIALLIFIIFCFFLLSEDLKKRFQNGKRTLVKLYQKKIDIENRKTLLDKKVDKRFLHLRVGLTIFFLVIAGVGYLFNENILKFIPYISPIFLLAEFTLNKKISVPFISNCLKNLIQEIIYSWNKFDPMEIEKIDLKISHQGEKFGNYKIL